MMDDFTRRDFLKGAGLALLGMAVSTSARAQQEEKPPEEDDEEANKPEDPEEEEKKDDLFGDDSTEDGEQEETRACPQCGALMYRQGRTWTCEACGYSYVE
jgi:ribosomal protein S27AE